MHLDSMFAVLGIAPTEDIREVKAAYAAKLNTFSPEEKPAEWAAIHDAYRSILDALSGRGPINGEHSFIPEQTDDFFASFAGGAGSHAEVEPGVKKEETENAENVFPFDLLFAGSQKNLYLDEVEDLVFSVIRELRGKGKLTEKGLCPLLEYSFFQEHKTEPEVAVIAAPVINICQQAPKKPVLESKAEKAILLYTEQLVQASVDISEINWLSLEHYAHRAAMLLGNRPITIWDMFPVTMNPHYAKQGTNDRTVAAMMPLLKIFAQDISSEETWYSITNFGENRPFDELVWRELRSYEKKLVKSTALSETYREMIKKNHYPSRLRKLKKGAEFLTKGIAQCKPGGWYALSKQLLDNEYYRDFRTTEETLKIMAPIYHALFIDNPSSRNQPNFTRIFELYCNELRSLMPAICKGSIPDDLYREYSNYYSRLP